MTRANVMRLRGYNAAPSYAEQESLLWIGQAFIGDGDPNAMARIVQGLMTGIGFGYWDLAIALSVCNFLMIFGMSRMKPVVNED